MGISKHSNVEVRAKAWKGVYFFDLDKIPNLSAQYDLTTLPGNLGGLTPTIDAA